jgi:hypothetical protein
MLWIEIGVTLLVGIVVTAIILANRPVGDLGSVSAHWIAEHSVDPP